MEGSFLSKLGLAVVSQRPLLVAAEAATLTVAIGAADVATGSELSFSIFYLLPITLVAWAMNLRWALVNALVASVVWFWADRWSGTAYANSLLPFWNAAIRLGYFVLFAVLFSRLRRSLDVERNLSRRDHLTGAFNRRAFEELAQREVDRSKRYGRPISLAFMDLDNFKAINDQYGHDTGDELLAVVASTLVGTVRTSDIVARIGGDEFAIVMPETSADQAHAALEKTRSAVSDRMAEHAWNVTFSIGVVSTTEGASQLSTLMAEADDLMYQAKRAGKDRIVAGRHEGALS